MMRSDLVVYPIVGIFLLLALLPHWRWHRRKTTPATLKPTRAKRQPKPFAGFTQKPECELCDSESAPHSPAPGARSPRMTFSRGRRRHVETTVHSCPHAQCAYHGRVDFGNIRANGHPNVRRWRQIYCLGCHRYFLETVGTPFHAKQVDLDK